MTIIRFRSIDLPQLAANSSIFSAFYNYWSASLCSPLFNNFWD